MDWTRRRLLELAAKLGLLSTLPVAVGCEEVDEEPMWPPFEGCDPTTSSWSYEGEPGPETLFAHGVASGDPLPGGVILWTRLTGAAAAETEVLWEVSESEGFATVLASAVVTTSESRDWTVKVDVTCLRPGTTYWYRFSALGRTSPVGRTKTAGYGPTEAVAFAFCSCSNYPSGYFHNYRKIAELDVDLVFHLGDYIYEYGGGGAPRAHDPPRELVSLEDYRRRYAQYRTDPDLQEAHRMHPFVCTWDDHETANNSWEEGAQNHNAGEGDWADRKAAARQAYFEWLPIRDGEVYRRITWGDLADFFVLDTRISGRDEQSTTQDEAFDPNRQMLGLVQEAWLVEGIADTRSTWTVLAQQVVMAQWSIAVDAEERPLPLNRDQWDGYPAARSRIFDAVLANKRDLVVLTGDVHSSWAHDLATDFNGYNTVTHTGSVGVEAVAAGITSGGGAIELGQTLAASTPHIRWADSENRGFAVIRMTHEEATAEWWLLPGGAIGSSTYVAPEIGHTMAVRPGEPWWVA